jgi:hypothetical protein
MSEAMLLGLGEGIGFTYWHTRGTLPHVGGRDNLRGELEALIAERTGVQIEVHTTASVKRAEQTMREMLSEGSPVVVQCDIGYLPQYQFEGFAYHFGGDTLVVWGFDAESRQVLITGRQEELHVVDMQDLKTARSSTYKPFLPKNRWFTFNFSAKRQPTPAEIYQALLRRVDAMLEPSISNLGIEGMRKTASLIRKWPTILSDKMLRDTLFKSYVGLGAQECGGGNILRPLFAEFLREGAEILNAPALNEAADHFEALKPAWDQAAQAFKQASSAPDPASAIQGTENPMLKLADAEEAAWKRLQAIVQEITV